MKDLEGPDLFFDKFCIGGSLMKVIKFLNVHAYPHPEEIFSILLLRVYGKEKYPGVDTAKIVFVDASNDLCKHNDEALYIGISSDGPEGSKFDEHPRAGQDRKKGHSAASLVAIDLGIQDLPEIRELLKAVTDEDLHGGAKFLDLASCVKILYDNLEPMQVIDWATVALQGRLNEQKNLHDQKNVEEFNRLVKTTEISHASKPVKIGVIETNNPLAGKCSRMQGYKILIQKDLDGHVQILPRKHDRIEMRDVVRLLRLEEDEIAGKSVRCDWKDLEGENCSKSPLWYLHPEGGFVMNGSRTHKGVPVTAIPLERILHLVVLALDDKAEHRACKVCTHDPKATGVLRFSCPLYQAGLLHCRQVRYKEAEAHGAVATVKVG